MLVVSRREGEALLLDTDGPGEPTEVTVLKIGKRSVRLGVKADGKVTIVRVSVAKSPLTSRPDDV